jgi:nucleoside-diphosphate-sugar epimerase
MPDTRTVKASQGPSQGWAEALVRVLVSGHAGYIGSVMAPAIRDAGHRVTGLDSGLFEDCTLGRTPRIPAVWMDIRDVGAGDLTGYDAVVHLAGISNDPFGNLDAQRTFAINHHASVHLAREAKRAGVERFLFASSCSLYGAADTQSLLTEEAPFAPVSAYGESKVLVEREVSALADDNFSPTFMRNATVYGYSPRLRADIVVNNLAGHAHLTGEVLIMSDGSPWRPLVHVEDVTRAFIAALEAPRELVHDQAFNVGRNEENYQIREVADIVAAAVPGSEVVYAPDGGADPRCYRVDFSKLHEVLPALDMGWTVASGAEELVAAYRRHGLTLEDFLGPRFTRLAHIKESIQRGEVDEDLRRLVPASGGSR